eukprot:361095-Chlamydomonas_euryale.AAC.1
MLASAAGVHVHGHRRARKHDLAPLLASATGVHVHGHRRARKHDLAPLLASAAGVHVHGHRRARKHDLAPLLASAAGVLPGLHVPHRARSVRDRRVRRAAAAGASGHSALRHRQHSPQPAPQVLWQSGLQNVNPASLPNLWGCKQAGHATMRTSLPN